MCWLCISTVIYIHSIILITWAIGITRNIAHRETNMPIAKGFNVTPLLSNYQEVLSGKPQGRVFGIVNDVFISVAVHIFARKRTKWN